MAYDLNGTEKQTYDLTGNQPAPAPETKLPFESTKLGIFFNAIKPSSMIDAAGGVAKDIAQGIGRSLGSFGQSIRNATFGKLPGIGYQPEIPRPPAEDVVGNKLYDTLYGEGRTVKDLSSRVADNERALKESPAAKALGLDKYAFPLAFGGVIGSTALDLTPGGAGEKNALKALVKEGTEEGAFKILKGIGIDDQIAKDFAPRFAATSDKAATKDLLDAAKSLHGTKQLADTAALKSADEATSLPSPARQVPENGLLRDISVGKGSALHDTSILSHEDNLAANLGTKEMKALDVAETGIARKKFGDNTLDTRKALDDVSTKINLNADTIDSNPIKGLWDIVRPYTKVIWDAKKPYLEKSLDEISVAATKNPKAADAVKQLDSRITEFGATDMADAQAKLEQWLTLRRDTQGLLEQRQALMQKFRSSRQETTDAISLENFLNRSAGRTEKEIAARDTARKIEKKSEAKKQLMAEAEAKRVEGYTPEITAANGGVVPKPGRGDIKAPELNLSEWRDKGALSLNRETMQRNIKQIAGKDAAKVDEFLVEPVRKNETDRIEFTNKIRKEAREKIVEKLGIRSGSKESALVQKYGEKILTPEEVELAAKNTNWKEIQEASRYFREQYDMLLDKVNDVRKKFGYTEIPKRDDYFRHFQEIGDSIKNFGLILREQDLPTEIAGITGIFNPGKPFSTAEMKRRGLKTTYDAIKGFDNYLDSISKQIFHIDSVQRGRTLEKYIRDSSKAVNEFNYGKPAESSLKQVKLPNFVSNLNNYTNIVAGKKSALDRALESMVGRPLYGISDWLSRRTSANMISGNLSSALTNFAPFTQSLATTKKLPAIRGVGEALLAPLKKADINIVDGVKSAVLTRRFPVKNIDLTGFKKAGEMANWLFESIDKFSARSILSAKYYENIAGGASKEAAMKAADDYTARVLADRSIGQTPNLFNSKSLRFITQFQTEVNNLYSFIRRDIPEMSNGSARKATSAIAQFVIYSYLFNSAFEKITGRRPVIDPIYAGLTVAGLTDEGENQPLGSRVGKAAIDIGENLPFVGGITGGRLPISSGVPNLVALLKGETTWGKELAKPATVLVPPFGGAQAAKTIKGISAYNKGSVSSASGKTQKYKVPHNPETLIRTALFGPSSTKEAKAYYLKQAQKGKSTKYGI